jgi:hypothetical protein
MKCSIHDGFGRSSWIRAASNKSTSAVIAIFDEDPIAGRALELLHTACYDPNCVTTSHLTRLGTLDRVSFPILRRRCNIERCASSPHSRKITALFGMALSNGAADTADRALFIEG